jgi:hypothetical protein
MSSKVVSYINLPTNIVCPINKELIGDGTRDVKMSVRIIVGKNIKDITVRCSRCPKGYHYPEDFKDIPEVYDNIMIEAETIKGNIKMYNQIDTNSESDEEDQDEEIIPDSEEIHKLKKEIYDKGYELDILCDSIANKYQEIVNKYQEIVNKSPDTKGTKYSPGESIKQQIWRKLFGDINKAYCPICNINEIAYDRFHACHIQPKSKGGSNRIDNLLPGCPACNTAMGTEHLYFYAYKVHKRILWK